MTHSSLHVANHCGPRTQKDDTNYDASSVCHHITFAKKSNDNLYHPCLCQYNMLTHGRCVIICIIFLGLWPEMVCNMQRAMRHNLYHLLFVSATMRQQIDACVHLYVHTYIFAHVNICMHVSKTVRCHGMA